MHAVYDGAHTPRCDGLHEAKAVILYVFSIVGLLTVHAAQQHVQQHPMQKNFFKLDQLWIPSTHWQKLQD